MNKLFKGRKQNEKATSQRQTVLTSFDCYSAYQGKSLHICLGFVPTQICKRHLDFLARMSQNCGLCRTLLVACVMPYHA